MQQSPEVYYQLLDLVELLSGVEVDARQFVHLQSLLRDKEVTESVAKECLYEVFGSFRHCEFIITKIMAFVSDGDLKERLSQVFDFYKCIPFNPKKLKNNSPGLEEIMTKEFESLGEQSRSFEPISLSE